MINRKYELPPCSVTAGQPFEKGPKCPLYQKGNIYLMSNGWEQVYYNSFNTGSGDMCNAKYKIREMAEDSNGKSEIVRMLEVSIEGTDSKHGNRCLLTLSLSTYHPENILMSMDHESEPEVMDKIDTEFRSQ